MDLIDSEVIPTARERLLLLTPTSFVLSSSLRSHRLAQVKRCSLAGHAEWFSTHRLFHEHPVAVDMVIDILSDRGFLVSYRPDTRQVPARVDLRTGEVVLASEPFHYFRIEFESERLREHTQRGTSGGCPNTAACGQPQC